MLISCVLVKLVVEGGKKELEFKNSNVVKFTNCKVVWGLQTLSLISELLYITNNMQLSPKGNWASGQNSIGASCVMGTSVSDSKAHQTEVNKLLWQGIIIHSGSAKFSTKRRTQPLQCIIGNKVFSASHLWFSMLMQNSMLRPVHPSLTGLLIPKYKFGNFWKDSGLPDSQPSTEHFCKINRNLKLN